MKKNLFRKFLALFLTGTMLAAVGCKDYDDDIDKINNRVDGLEGQITALNDVDSRLKVVEGVCDKFKNFDPNKDYAVKQDITDKLNAAKTQWLAEVEAKGYLTKATLADALTGLDFNFATQKTIEAMKTALNGYFAGANSGLNDTEKAEVKKQIEDYLKGITDLSTSVLGTAMANYLKAYVGADSFGAGVSKEVLAELQKENSVYKDALYSYVKGYIATTEGQEKVILQKDLDTAFGTYKANINALWSAVGNLANRIQSMVFVPTNIDGYAHTYLMKLGDKALNAPYFELTFRVSPASLAPELVKSASFALKSKAVTRAAGPVLGTPTVTNEAEGEITFVITDTDAANYVTDAQGPKEAQAVAIVVKNGEGDVNPGWEADAEGTDVDTSIDFTTSYVMLVADADADVDDNFVLVNAEGEEYDADVDNYELDYTTDDVVTLMSNYTLMYKEKAGEYIAIDGEEGAAAKYHWNVVPALVIENTVAKYGNQADVANDGTVWSTVMGQAATVFGKPAGDPIASANKAKVVEVQLKSDKKVAASLDYKFYLERKVFVKAGSNAAVQLSGNHATYKGQVKVVKHLLGEYEFNLFMNWDYTKWQSGKSGSDWSNVSYIPVSDAGKAYIVLEPKLDVDDFNALADDASAWTIKDNTGFKPTASDAEALVVTSAKKAGGVVEGNDAQALELTVKNYKNGYGSVVVEKTIDSGDGNKISITATLTFAQPFSAGAPTVSLVESIPFSTSAQAISAKDWIKTLYNATADLKSKFGFSTEADFTTYVKTYAIENTAAAAVKNVTTNAATFDASTGEVKIALLTADFMQTPNTVTLDSKLTLTDAPFEIKIAKTPVAVTKPADAVLEAQWQLGEKAQGPNPADNGDAFTVAAVELLNYYNAKAVSAEKKVVFALVTEGKTSVEQTEIAKASITADNKLNWGTCNLTSLDLTASLVSSDGSTTYDVRSFTVDLKTPIDVTAIAMLPAAEVDQTLTAGGEQTINLISMLTWKDIFGNEVVDKDNNKIFDKYAAAACYNIPEVDWSSAVVTLAKGGQNVPSTPLTLEAGTIKYNINNIDATQTYTVTVSGVVVGARYNEPNENVTITFQLKPAAN